ncbi:hypothetical protein SEA_JORDANFARM_52 [Microbacterium phage JordanFarm]
MKSMSDASATTPPPAQEPYVSGIDPAFSAAWGLVYSEEEQEETPQGAETPEPGGDGSPAPAAPTEGAPAAAGDAAAPAGGAESKGIPSALELIQKLHGGDKPAEDGDGQSGTGEAQPEGAGVPDTASEGIDPATVIPAFATASAAITERLEKTFKAQAFQELQSEIDPKFVEALQLRPMQMVGMEVPSVRRGAGKDEMMKILDSNMAREWQETVNGLIEDEIDDKVKTKTEEARGMTSVIQSSILLGQNNPDLIPGTKGFNPELAARFVKFAKAYEVRTANGVIGYQVDVQPLVNELREAIAAERGAGDANKKNEERAAQQRAQAAAQPRTTEGKFDAPQAGIKSTAGMAGEPEESFGDFWRAAGILPPGMNLSI